MPPDVGSASTIMQSGQLIDTGTDNVSIHSAQSFQSVSSGRFAARPSLVTQRRRPPLPPPLPRSDRQFQGVLPDIPPTSSLSKSSGMSSVSSSISSLPPRLGYTCLDTEGGKSVKTLRAHASHRAVGGGQRRGGDASSDSGSVRSFSSKQSIPNGHHTSTDFEHAISSFDQVGCPILARLCLYWPCSSLVCQMSGLS